MPSFPNRCQHLKINGTQCGSPALRRNKFCYFHKRHHEERLQLNADRAQRRRNVTIELPVLEDANAIQISLMQIMRLVVTGQIDSKSAGLLLYALQTASTNLARTSFEPFMKHIILDPRAVHETPLNSLIWDDSDFIDEDEEETMRAQALEKARARAEKIAEADRWAEAELEKEREKKRESDARFEAEYSFNEKRRKDALKNPPAWATQKRTRLPEVEPAPSAPSPARRPPAHVDMKEVRKSVQDQFRKAIPAVLAAQSARENGGSSA